MRIDTRHHPRIRARLTRESRNVKQRSKKAPRACRLCLEQKPLRRSHIIPEFLYETIYDETGRMFVRSAIGKPISETRQVGYREYLLCADCETQIGKWERYVSHVWRNKVQLDSHRQGSLMVIEGLDYRQFKLFQMSVLWRAAISKLQPFSGVNIGPHEERLRQLLFASNPGQQNDYPCTMTMLLLEDKPAIDMFIEPTWCKPMLHGSAYRFVFGGFLWVYNLSGIPLAVRQLAISETGTLSVFVDDAGEIHFISDVIARVIANEASVQPK